jgi:hypothetical protein
MMRMQIRLSSEDCQAAKKEAKRLGISLSELLRQSLRSILPSKEDAPWMKFAGMVDSGKLSSSQCIDEIVYGP